ncbi:MAG: DUF4139 domain-containing protein [Methanohalobium sp.]|uniref:DUF4139 domain-containing protein n=1 Tax=Methanohalobium sp. TaxID=2837493 RepID=UPI0039782C75
MNGDSNENYLIYDSNQGSIVEKDIRLELNSGVQWIELEDLKNLKNVNPDSIKVEPENMNADEVMGIKTSVGDDLRNNIGKQIEIELTSGKTVTGILLRIENNYPSGYLVLENEDGVFYITENNINQIKTTNQTGTKVMAKIDATRSGTHDFQLRYQIDGITWDASYNLYMKDSDRSNRFSGDMIIKNPSNKNFDGNFYLISGQVMNRYVGFAESPMMDEFERSISETQKVGRMYLYDLGHLTLDQHSQQSTKYLDQRIDSKTEYLYTTFRQSGNENVQQLLSFTNDNEPLPKGTVNVYKEKDGLQVMIGQSSIDRTPAGAEVEINLGNTFDLKGETRILEENKKENNITRAGEITITNFDRSPKTVTVHYMWVFGELLNSNIDTVDRTADYIEWKVNVGANSERTIEFEVAEEIKETTVKGSKASAEKEISPGN